MDSSKSAPANRSVAGPFDVAEVRDVSPYIDFGAIRIQHAPGRQLRLEVEEATQRVIAITVEEGGSILQLQAFAAPKTEGLWHEIRAQLRASIEAQGGLIDEHIGAVGPEILARFKVTSDQGQGERLVKFLGVDGPRWLLRGVLTGAALVDPKAAADAIDLFKSVVVVRGDLPLPPRELIPIKMPGGVVPPPRMSV